MVLAFTHRETAWHIKHSSAIQSTTGLGESCGLVTRDGIATRRLGGRQGTLDHVLETGRVVRSSNGAWITHEEVTTFSTQEPGYMES